MRTTIRFACFETNSSSTHALVTLTDEEYERWTSSGGALVLAVNPDKDKASVVGDGEIVDKLGVARGEDGKWKSNTDGDDWFSEVSRNMASSINKQVETSGKAIAVEEYPNISWTIEKKVENGYSIDIEADDF